MPSKKARSKSPRAKKRPTNWAGRCIVHPEPREKSPHREAEAWLAAYWRGDNPPEQAERTFAETLGDALKELEAFCHRLGEPGFPAVGTWHDFGEGFTVLLPSVRFDTPERRDLNHALGLLSFAAREYREENVAAAAVHLFQLGRILERLRLVQLPQMRPQQYKGKADSVLREATRRALEKARASERGRSPKQDVILAYLKGEGVARVMRPPSKRERRIESRFKDVRATPKETDSLTWKGDDGKQRKMKIGTWKNRLGKWIKNGFSD